MIKAKNMGFVCLISLALLGDILLNLRFTGNLLDDVIGVLCAVILSALSVYLIMLLINASKKSRLRRKNTLKAVGLGLFLLLALSIIVFTVYSFAAFAAPVMLKTKNVFFPFLAMLGIALFLGLSAKKVLIKTALLALPVVFGIIILLFAFSVQFMSAKYLVPYKVPDGSFLETFLPLYLNLTLSALPFAFVFKESSVKSFICSYGVCGIIIGISLVNVLGMFGSELASALSYPYATAVSAAAMGEIFSRLDGFFYSLCFFTVLIKTAVCIYSFKVTANKIISEIKP